MNGIQVYKGNSLTLTVQISSDEDNIVLSGFTPLFNIDFNDEVTTITGSTINSGCTTFNISREINNKESYVYSYQVDIVGATNTYTIIKDSYSILPAIINT